MAAYLALDLALQANKNAKKARFFRVANIVNSRGIAPGIIFGQLPVEFPITQETAEYLEAIGDRLFQEVNGPNFAHLVIGENAPGTGSLSDKALDYKLVEIEQDKVEQFTNDHFGVDGIAKQNAISDINERISAARDKLDTYPEIIVALEEEFGSEAFDFGNKDHRIRLGKKMIDMIYEQESGS